MTRFPLLRLAALCAAFVLAASAQPPNAPRKRRVLAIGEVKGFQHDSVSQALATIYRMGKDTGAYDTYIRTDTQLITKKRLTGNAKNIDFFDAVVFYTTGELPLDDEQKAALMAFVKEDGKGFVGVHSAIDTFYKWPEYGDMVGAYFDLHPWNTFKAPIVVEDRKFPATAHFPKAFELYDEIYQPSSLFSREKVRVLARLDENKIDLSNRNVRRTDKDFAVAWIKEHGKGRVFYSTFGHTPEAWDHPGVQKMYFEAIRWALRVTNPDDVKPRPRPAE
ncbi:MAG TPA: ThuA domain-containing protein [Solibacterales bacterium]|nr:ThuA domain-containing protein [Bryobacterales bacterium]